MPKKELNIGRFTDMEREYVRHNYTQMRDEDLGEHLNRKTKSIMQLRKRMGLKKKRGSSAKKFVDRIAAKNLMDTVSGIGDDIDYDSLNEASKTNAIEIIKNRFVKTQKYHSLIKILSGEELGWYVERYAVYLVQFRDLPPAEDDILHNLLMTQIKKQRNLEEDKRQRDIFFESIDGGDTNIEYNKSDKEYHEITETETKLAKSLKATREQRLGKKEVSGSINIIQLMQKFNDKSHAKEEAIKEAFISIAKDAWLQQQRKDMDENSVHQILGDF